MLSFNIRSLEQHAITVDGLLDADDEVWQEGDPRPTEPVKVTGRLSHAGPGRFYWSGRIEGEMGGTCRRCLRDTASRISTEVNALFAEAGEDTADDPDVYELAPHAQEIDLKPAVREEWVLSAPRIMLCQEECKGLCARCGTDLNEGQCECPPEIDARWESLRAASERPE